MSLCSPIRFWMPPQMSTAGPDMARLTTALVKRVRHFLFLCSWSFSFANSPRTQHRHPHCHACGCHHSHDLLRVPESYARRMRPTMQLMDFVRRGIPATVTSESRQVAGAVAGLAFTFAQTVTWVRRAHPTTPSNHAHAFPGADADSEAGTECVHAHPSAGAHGGRRPEKDQVVSAT